jgi:hypothetical protein
MSLTPSPPTIREDWNRRLAALVSQGNDRSATANLQIALLDALLARYGEWEAAAKPARFAMPGKAFAHRDALLAQHGLTKSFEIVRNERQAHDRMARVLKRMAATNEEPEVATQEAEGGFAPMTKNVRRANRWRRG